jgi:hypothetical protein
MQTTQQITRISCLACNTRIGEQKTKLETASNAVARAYCPQPSGIRKQTPLTKSYNFRNAFG